MFNWFKRRAQNEQIKLLYQNSSASKILVSHFEMSGDLETASELASIARQTHVFATTLNSIGQLSGGELRTLLDNNKQLRILFERSEREGGKAAFSEMTGRPVVVRDFDQVFQPMSGWKDYYSTW